MHKKDGSFHVTIHDPKWVLRLFVEWDEDAKMSKENAIMQMHRSRLATQWLMGNDETEDVDELTWMLDVDTDSIVEESIRTVNVEIGYPLFLYDTVLLDGKRLGISGDPDLAIGSRVEVVDLFPSLIADLGSSIGRLTRSRDERIKDAIVLCMLRLDDVSRRLARWMEAKRKWGRKGKGKGIR